jgi:son of sevenless-like protein
VPAVLICVADPLACVGVYLTDLTFLEDGNPNTLNNRQELINFDKRRKVAAVIKEIQQYQITPYNFRDEQTIRDYLNSIEGLTDKALYKYSLICEPRGGRDSQANVSTRTLLRKFKWEM